MRTTIPPSVQAALWSYDMQKLDVEIDHDLIIGAVLNYGTKEATDWIFAHYGLPEVRCSAELLPQGAWDKRSLALWSLILGINPVPRQVRFT